MGIVIIFMMFVFMAVFASLVISAIISFALIPLAYYIFKTPKEKQITGWQKTLVMCGICVGLSVTAIGLGIYGGTVLATGERGPTPLKDAHKLIGLPPEAEVTKVEYGDWAGDFFVEFRLPATKTPEEWLKIVWDLNSAKQKNFDNYEFRKDTESIGIYCHGVAHMSITYDPQSNMYRFEHYFES